MMFESYTRWIGRRVVPQPSQLFGLAAQARYAQWASDRADEARSDRDKKDVIVRGFTIEERNLRALCKSLRLPPHDVLVKKPDQFPVRFLKHKGVYRLVREQRRKLVHA